MSGAAESLPERIRVIRIIARLNVGGPARHVILLDKGLRQRGFETLLVHGRTGDAEASFDDLAKQSGIPTRLIAALGRRVRLSGDLRAFFSVLRLLWREQPDVVHTHTAKAGAIGRLASLVINACRPRDRRCAVVHTFHGHVFHGYFGQMGSRLVQGIERALARITDRVIAISTEQRLDLVERYAIAPARRVVVVPLGLDLEGYRTLPRRDAQIRERLGFQEHHFVIGYVGRLVPIKQVDRLLAAVAIAARSEPAVHLLVVGDGEQRRMLEDRVDELGVRSRVKFVGWQYDLHRIYPALDVLMLTSASEGTPVAAIEAMAAGVPVMGSAVGGVPDVIADGLTGVLLHDLTPEAIAARIVDALASPDRFDAMAFRARASVFDRYTPTALVDRVAGLYRAALLEKRTGRTRAAAGS